MTRLASLVSTVLIGAALLLAPACDKGARGNESKQASKSADPAASDSAKTPADTAPAADGKKYGAGVDLEQSTPITAIVDDPTAYDGKKVRVEGLVTDVCEKRGCWFEMAGDAPGKKLRFKVQDGVMVFPMTAKGQYAVAEGIVKVQQLSLEETREFAAHEAEEQGKELDPNSITEPKTVVRIDGTGAMLRDNK